MKKTILFTILILSIMIISIVIYVNKTKDYIPTTAFINKYSYENDDGRVSYNYNLRFTINKKDIYTDYLDGPSFKPEIGKKVKILYDPNNPEKIIFSGINTFWSFMILLAFFLIRYICNSKEVVPTFLMMFGIFVYLLTASASRIFNPFTLIQKMPLISIFYLVGLAGLYWILIKKEFKKIQSIDD